MKAIIAAGGSGTRLRPLTFSSNKHLLPVANKPLLFYAIESIVETGIKNIGIIVNQTKKDIESLVGYGGKWGVNVTYIDQPDPLGLAHVVQISETFLEGEPFIFHLGDNIFTDGIMKPFKKFKKTKPSGLLTMVEHEENFRLGVPFFDKEGKLLKVVEKPEKPPNKYGVPGLYFFNKDVFKAFRGKDAIKPSARGELEITDLYTYLLEHDYKVETEEVDGQWMDPGKFTDMLDANFYLLDRLDGPEIKGEVDEASLITGSVKIEEGARIVNSQIIGPVAIGKNTMIQECQVGPHVAVAKNCKLENVKLNSSVVMDDSTLMHVKRQIEHSLVGRNTEVWEEKRDAVSLFIGDHCRVRVT